MHPPGQRQPRRRTACNAGARSSTRPSWASNRARRQTTPARNPGKSWLRVVEPGSERVQGPPLRRRRCGSRLCGRSLYHPRVRVRVGGHPILPPPPASVTCSVLQKTVLFPISHPICPRPRSAGSSRRPSRGYIEAIREIEQQIQLSGDVQFDDIVVACGSGGTVAGLALGSQLSSLKTKVHAFSVCYGAEYFYDNVQGLIDELQSGLNSRDIVRIEDAKGIGYAMNTPEELKFVRDIAAATGIVLDPVYSGKAAYRMLRDMSNNPTKWEGRKVLFVHTGGLLGLYDKVDQLSSLAGGWRRMDLGELEHAKVQWRIQKLVQA